MKKIILFINFIVFCLGAGYCAEVTVGDVRSVAGVHAMLGYTQRLKAGALSAPDYSVKEIRTLNDTDTKEVLAYVVLLEPKGFIAVSKDDNIAPVIAYSFNNNFSFEENEENVLLHMLRMDMGMRIEAMPLTSDQVKEENKQLWDNYISKPDYIYNIQTAEQWPAGDDTGWIDTTWDQSSPYNDLCPIDPDTGNRSVVGCVATAMAQIINFHRYPTSISFTSEDSYTTKSSSITIDTDHTAQDFPSFSELNSLLSDIDYTDSAESYAPALCFACGIMVDMNYTSTGSGANTLASTTSFTSNLNYRDAIAIEGNNYKLYNILKEDMKSRRPVLLSIDNSNYTAGHAIVADGYRSTNEYHLNFGGGASQPDAIEECWYLLPYNMPLNYSVIKGAVVNITPSGFVSNQYGHVINYPNPFYPDGYNRVTIAIQDESTDLIKEVRIYNLTGKLIKKLEGKTYVTWDGENQEGNTCSSGLYFYAVKTVSGKIRRGKISVLR